MSKKMFPLLVSAIFFVGLATSLISATECKCSDAGANCNPGFILCDLGHGQDCTIECQIKNLKGDAYDISYLECGHITSGGGAGDAAAYAAAQLWWYCWLYGC